MSMNKLIQSLQELHVLHLDLLHVSKEKTETIKEGDTVKLQQILARERKLVRKLEKVENDRVLFVNAWVEENGIKEEPTITKMLEWIHEEDLKIELEKATIDLTKAMTDLKAQEKLNLALLNQSMQFVQLSLDLLSPSLKNMNYSQSNQTIDTSRSRSIFDTKA